MLDEKNELNITETQELNQAIDNSTALLPLDEEETKIVNNIIKAPTQKDLQEQFDLFNINQSKKNALRIIKLTSLLDKVEDQAIERFNKRPDQASHKELLDYMQVVANQIDRSQKFIETLKDKPMIKVNTQKNEVNINIGTELSKDSKEKVMDAIHILLKQLDQTNNKVDTQEEVINADFITTDEKNVYNKETECAEDSSDIIEPLLREEGEN